MFEKFLQPSDGSKSSGLGGSDADSAAHQTALRERKWIAAKPSQADAASTGLRLGPESINMSKRRVIWFVVPIVIVGALLALHRLNRADGEQAGHVTYRSDSGDLVQFLMRELRQYGATNVFALGFASAGPYEV